MYQVHEQFALSIPVAGGAPVEPRSLSAVPSGMTLDLERTAFIVIDPQADFLRSMNATPPVPGHGTTQCRAIRNLTRLCEAAQHVGITVAISLTADGFRGADFFMSDLKPYIAGDTTIICSPHKRYTPLPRVNDSGRQLRRQRVRQVILGGLIANLPLESHLRDFLEQGFEVAVVRDAIAGPKLPEGDGYLSALVNFRGIATALWTTEQALNALGRAEGVSRPRAREQVR